MFYLNFVCTTVLNVQQFRDVKITKLLRYFVDFNIGTVKIIICRTKQLFKLNSNSIQTLLMISEELKLVILAALIYNNMSWVDLEVFLQEVAKLIFFSLTTTL